MLFARGPSLEDAEALLGDLACSLEPRARLQAPVGFGFGPRYRLSPRVTLFMAAHAVSREERERLAGAPGAELVHLAGDGLHLTIAPDALEELARDSAVARCLLASLRAAWTPPGPMRVMGILNVTPDSFSDGGDHFETERAIERGRALIDEGADSVDVGGESSRPGAEPVSAETEARRVLPVITALADHGGAVISVDTTRASVARAALEAGATVVNDISAGRNDPTMLPLVAERGAGVVLMHMQGTPRNMQQAPAYEDVVREVTAHLRDRARAAWRAGVGLERIALDPGLGFGKLLEHNLSLMRALPELRSLGFPLVLGASRKSFLGRLSGKERPAARGPETTAAVALGAFLGAEIHRVHEIGPARAALCVAWALAADKGIPTR